MPVIRVAASVMALCMVVLAGSVAEAQSPGRSGANLLRQSAEAGLRPSRPLDVRRFDGVSIAPLRRPPHLDEAALLRSLRRSDADLARALEGADPALRRAALEVQEGARAIERAMPANAVRRTEIVERGGVDLLRAASRPVEGLGDTLVLLDGSMRAGRLPDTALAQFGRALNAHGESFAKIWRDYIVPNWEVGVAGGLVTALLVDPDRFVDAAGKLTQHAVAAFTDLGIEVGTSVAGGMAQGLRRNFERRIAAGNGWTLLAVGSVVVGGFMVVMLRRRRKAGGPKR